MTSVDSGIPTNDLAAAIQELWRIPTPGPENLQSHPAHNRLRLAMDARCAGVNAFGGYIALSTALRGLGLPCTLGEDRQGLALDVGQAIGELERAIASQTTSRTYMVPLDLADDLPELVFGNARVARLSTAELSSLVERERLARLYNGEVFEAARFSQFQWLVVREEVPNPSESGRRPLPRFEFDPGADPGRIEPHTGKFPLVVETAIFWLALAPWECWAEMPEIDWRGFRAPWVYTINHDLFSNMRRAPSPDTLNWEDHVFEDAHGHICEVERPLILNLAEQAGTGLIEHMLRHSSAMPHFHASELFSTPVVHFFVRAYLADGIDEFLAHMTAVEAALGLPEDHKRKMSTGEKRHDLGATDRLCARIYALLGEKAYADQYKELFEIRSKFLHGRPMGVIPTSDRITARSLARRVVDALVFASQTEPGHQRGYFLDQLLDQGTRVLRSATQARLAH